MIELAVFLAFQTLTNLLAKSFLSAKGQYIFGAIAYAFALLMILYPFMVINFYYDNFYNEGDIKCGNIYIGMTLFFWIIGVPLVFIIQFLFNKFMLSPTIPTDDNQPLSK